MNDLTLKNIRIVLARPSHPGNIGATARAMKTMGLSELHLVTPKAFPHADADARATGALDVLQAARVHEHLEQALQGCVLSVAASSRRRELRHETLDARSAARDMLTQARSQPVALVFGNEATGLTREEAGLCTLWAHIPTDPGYASLNIASAVQVFAYELYMALETAPDAQTAPAVPEFPPATHEQVAQLYEHMLRTMADTGFFDQASAKRLEPRLRRLLARARLESEEVNILRGFLNSVSSRLKR